MRIRLPRRPSLRPFLICGTDTLALRLVEQLQEAGESVVVVVPSATGSRARAMAGLGARIVTGSAVDEQTLLTAGVADAHAVAFVDADDVANLHAAFLVHKLNPTVRLVIRMFSRDFGRDVENLFSDRGGDCAVLSASAIAAPSFVDAALNKASERLVPIRGHLLKAGKPRAVRDPLIELAGPGPQPGADPILLPTDPLPPDPDANCVLGWPTSAPNRRPDTGELRVRDRPRRLRTVAALARTAVSRRLRWTMAFFAVLLCVATWVFHQTIDMGWLSAFTAAMASVTTGGPEAVMNAAPGVQLFGIALTFIGFLVLAMLTAFIVDDLISTRELQTSGVPIGRISNHAVVCGLGSVGLRVVEQLRDNGIDVIGIDLEPSQTAYATARRLGVPVIQGNSGKKAILLQARAAQARVVLALTDDDVRNLQAGLACRALAEPLPAERTRHPRVVLRLFDDGMARLAKGHLDNAESRSVSAAAAPSFLAAMMGRAVIAAVPYDRRILLVAEVPVAEGSDLANRTIGDVAEPGQIRVFGHVSSTPTAGRRGNGVTELLQWLPTLDTVVHPGQSLLIAATRQGLTNVLVRATAP